MRFARVVVYHAHFGARGESLEGYQRLGIHEHHLVNRLVRKVVYRA